MKIAAAEENDDPVLNLTPMIDVVFNLMLFFMLATTFLKVERDLDLELPQARNSAEQRGRVELELEVLRDGSIYVGGRALDSAQLTRELAQAAQRDPRASITIRGDRRCEHQSIVRVLDACRAAGLSHLALSTRREG